MAKRSTVLSSEQLAQFQDNGFLVLRSVVAPAELEQMRTLVVQLFEQRSGREEGAYYDLVGHDDDSSTPALPQLTDPMNFAPGLRRTDVFTLATRIARELLGADASFANDHAILKPAFYGEATPWHQDEAYRASPAWQFRELSFWIPLQDATVENGCMHYAAGSHQYNILPHRPYNEDPKVHALECGHWIDPESKVACPVQAGDLIIHHTRTAHYAGPNTTSIARYAYILIYEAPPLPVENGQLFEWVDTRNTAAMERRKNWLQQTGRRQELLRKLGRLWHNPRRYINKMMYNRW